MASVSDKHNHWRPGAPAKKPQDDEVEFFPQPPARTDTMHSRYVEMLLKQDKIPMMHTLLAAFFVWLLLAGFIVFPGTFTTLQESMKKDHKFDNGATEKLLKSVKNVPLLVFGAIACGVSGMGMLVLGLRHIRNYIWVLNKLILPGLANCLAGLISTLVGVYSQQHGTWSITAKVTAIVEGACLGMAILLFVVFERVLLKKVRESHEVHYNDSWPKKDSFF